MKTIAMVVLLTTLATGGCRSSEGTAEMQTRATRVGSAQEPSKRLYDSLAAAGMSQATFAAGCFWCVEQAFDKVPGVLATISGYTGGSVANPTYEEVSRGTTGHAEAVTVFFDPSKVSYPELLDIYWRNVDPLTADAQFCDVGTQYRPAIFTHGEEQRRLADSSRAALDASRRFDKPIVTEIVDASAFTVAEEYHQDFYLKNPDRYADYKLGCGREQRLRQLWRD